jgi:hypothetical protein
VIEGLTKVFYPESSTVVFVIMVIVLLLRPAGLFGKRKIMNKKIGIAVCHCCWRRRSAATRCS